MRKIVKDPKDATYALSMANDISRNKWKSFTPRSKPGAEEFLTIAQKNNIPFVIISNGIKERVPGMFYKTFNNKFPDTKIYCDAGKPDPTIIRQILADNNTLASEALVVGDRFRTDIKAAISAGVPSVLVDKHEHTLVRQFMKSEIEGGGVAFLGYYVWMGFHN